MKKFLILCVGLCGGLLMVATDRASAADVVPKKVLRHLVLYKFKTETTPAQVQEVIDAFSKLAKQVDTIIGYEHGTNVSKEMKDDGLTHCFMVMFKDEAGRDAYIKHPAHDAYVQVVKDKREKVIVVDFWSEP